MENEQYDIIEQLINTKNYDQLTTSEKDLIDQELGGQTGFEEMQTLRHDALNSKEINVSKQIKKDLIYQMKQARPGFWHKVINYRVPAYQTAAIMVFVLVLFWLVRPEKETIVEKMVQLPPVTDTLLVELPGDTVFLEKLVEVKVPIYITQQTELIEKPEKDDPIKGSSMAEQEVLQDLLVSTR